jgi:hypothetical protein
MEINKSVLLDLAGQYEAVNVTNAFIERYGLTRIFSLSLSLSLSLYLSSSSPPYLAFLLLNEKIHF